MQKKKIQVLGGVARPFWHLSGRVGSVGDLPDFELTYREALIYRQTQQVATATVFSYTVGSVICITVTVVITVEGRIKCF